MQKITRNATRCNNRIDLLPLSLTLKISIVEHYDGAFIAKIVSRKVYSQKAPL